MKKAAVIVRPCAPGTEPSQITATVHEMLDRIPGLADRAARSRKIFIKINLSPLGRREYLGHSVECVDPLVFRALASWFQARTPGVILAGDGTDGMGFEPAARDEGHQAVMDELGVTALNLNEGPVRRFLVPRPAMFRWYDLSTELADVDLFVSLAKMKSHHLCGVTLSIKNLFGLPPNSVYGSPRLVLHSPVRIAGILADLLQIFPPDLCFIDGIVGAGSWEWGGDPVSSGVLVAGDNAVATDAAAARWMGVDPGAPRGTPPFNIADNHLRLCAEHGLGELGEDQVLLDGEMPPVRRVFTSAGSGEPAFLRRTQERREVLCGLARGYFADRERYVHEYKGQVISVDAHGVTAHGPSGRAFTEGFFARHREQGHSDEETWYGAFIKLVEEEEAELAAPYAQA